MSPADGTLGSRFVAPLVTWLVADAGAGEELGDALTGTMRALERVGVLRGRQFVLLGGDPVAGGAPDRARALRALLGVPVIVHHPERHGFVAGELPDGTPLELDDELREAEAIVSVGGGSPWARATVVVPGACVARTRVAFEATRAEAGRAAAWAFLQAAERLAPIDLAVAWDPNGRVWSASGSHALAAFELADAAEPSVLAPRPSGP